MNIQFDAKTMITSDERSWMICQKSVSKQTGEVTWNPKYYFPTLEQLLVFLAHKQIRGLDCTSLTDAIKGAEAVAKDIGELFNVTVKVGQ